MTAFFFGVAIGALIVLGIQNVETIKRLIDMARARVEK